ncbi:hypothetical protein IWQ57_004890, partial [Coemansia nantahalensis]
RGAVVSRHARQHRRPWDAGCGLDVGSAVRGRGARPRLRPAVPGRPGNAPARRAPLERLVGGDAAGDARCQRGVWLGPPDRLLFGDSPHGIARAGAGRRSGQQQRGGGPGRVVGRGLRQRACRSVRPRHGLFVRRRRDAVVKAPGRRAGCGACRSCRRRFHKRAGSIPLLRRGGRPADQRSHGGYSKEAQSQL